MEQGLEQGLERGVAQAVQATVRRLIQRGGYTDAEIAEIAGTDEAGVRAVAASMGAVQA